MARLTHPRWQASDFVSGLLDLFRGWILCLACGRRSSTVLEANESGERIRSGPWTLNLNDARTILNDQQRSLRVRSRPPSNRRDPVGPCKAYTPLLLLLLSLLSSSKKCYQTLGSQEKHVIHESSARDQHHGTRCAFVPG